MAGAATEVGKMCSHVACDAPAGQSRLHEQPERCLAQFYVLGHACTQFAQVLLDPRANEFPLRTK